MVPTYTDSASKETVFFFSEKGTLNKKWVRLHPLTALRYAPSFIYTRGVFKTQSNIQEGTICENS